jgi:hypothetical protein
MRTEKLEKEVIELRHEIDLLKENNDHDDIQTEVSASSTAEEGTAVQVEIIEGNYATGTVDTSQSDAEPVSVELPSDTIPVGVAH